jgi:hypothetical protein
MVTKTVEVGDRIISIIQHHAENSEESQFLDINLNVFLCRVINYCSAIHTHIYIYIYIYMGNGIYIHTLLLSKIGK